MSTPQAPPRRKHFSRKEYHWLHENGLFQEGQRYELFNGDILEIMPQNEPHSTLVMRLLFALAALFGQEFVRCQMPIILSNDTEPEPGVAVMATPGSVVIASGDVPPATDIRLVVEVSVSTLEFDAGAKADSLRPERDSRVLGVGRGRTCSPCAS